MSLIGIYSFPKSGNTWLRAIISHAIGNQNNELIRLRGQFKELPDVPDLHQQSLDTAKACNGYRFFKLHTGVHLQSWGKIKLDVSSVIHVRRNPLDVFISYLNYISRNVTNTAPIKFESVDEIFNTQLFDIYFDHFIAAGHLAPRFAHITGSYFSHNKYWLTQNDIPSWTLKYEDLLRDPLTQLSFLEPILNISSGELGQAIKLADQSTSLDQRFFWKRREKSYFEYLNRAQIEKFLAYRDAECQVLGYSPDYLLAPPSPSW